MMLTPVMTHQVNAFTGEVMDVEYFSREQMLEYGKSEFQRALLLAMNTTHAFGSTGRIIAVIIGSIDKETA
jgi:hypothetical protein